MFSIDKLTLAYVKHKNTEKNICVVDDFTKLLKHHGRVTEKIIYIYFLHSLIMKNTT